MLSVLFALSLGQVGLPIDEQQAIGCTEGSYSTCVLANCAIPVKECLDGTLTACYCLVKSCNDGNPCTTDRVLNFACDHAPVNVNDGNACTADACNPVTGAITHTVVNVDDGNACTTDACNTTTGAITHASVPTDDGIACTTDSCNSATGVVSHTLTCTAAMTFFCHDKYGQVTRKVVCTQGSSCTPACP